MPLESGSDKEVIRRNIKTLIGEGRSPDQAAAIAYKFALDGKEVDSEPLVPEEGFAMDKAFYDANGFKTSSEVPISKAGIVKYGGGQLLPAYQGSPENAPESNKVYDVYRPPEELEKAAETFRLLPWVNDHPGKILSGDGSTGWTVDNKNVLGIIGEDVAFDGEFLRANLKCFSPELAAEIQSGKRQLSAGFRHEIYYEPGNHNGISYDYVQRNLIGNHVALVEDGRCGSDCSIMDSLNLTNEVNDMPDTPPGEQQQQEQVNVGELMTKLVQALDGINQKLDALAEKESKEQEQSAPPAANDEDKADDKPEDEKDPASAMDAAYKCVSEIAGAFDTKGMKSMKQIAEAGCKALGIGGGQDPLAAIMAYGKARGGNAAASTMDSAKISGESENARLVRLAKERAGN